MKVVTSRFGEIEVPDDSVINFPEGVVGFKECNKFVIFDCSDDGVFKWLQSCDKDDVAFVICEASMIVPEYQAILGQKELDALQAKDLSELVTCLILCIPEDPKEMTANLLGPIVFNAEKRVGMQMVLINPGYSTQYKVFADPDNDSKKSDKSAKKEDNNARS